MTLRFNPPPNWPAPPTGWTPPAGWQPDPSWGPAPEGWNFWVDDAAAAAVSGPKQGSWFARHKVLTGVAATAVVGIVAVGASGGGDDAADAASQSSAVASSTPSSASSADDASAAADADDAAAAAKAAKEKAAKEKAAKEKAAKEKAAKEKAAKEKAATPGLKDKVRDGKFEFTVTGVDCGATKIGDEYINTKAQGEFCLVHMKVKNIGDEAQSFFADNQTAYNAKGQEFSADSGAAIYLADADSFMSEINPGNSIKGTVVFDVPKGTDLTSIDLHDSFFSGGVTVALK